MKKFIFFMLLALSVSLCSNVFAQLVPAGAGDRILADNDIKLRSVELERIKRESEKGNLPSVMNPEVASKFKQIKEDFENVQVAEAAIIKAYTTGEKIDYGLIEISAKAVNKSAKRLDSNMFAFKLEKKEYISKEKPSIVKDMIVELDKAISSFVSSEIFKDLKVVDAEIAKKAQLDLAAIMEMSSKLSKEANKMK